MALCEVTIRLYSDHPYRADVAELETFGTELEGTVQRGLERAQAVRDESQQQVVRMGEHA